MTLSPLRILLIEDNLGDARLILEMFHEEKPGSFEMTHVVSMKEAAAFLAGGGAVDVTLLDLNLPDVTGLETLTRALAIAPGVAVLVLTCLDDEALAIQAMQLGAQDYLVKGRIENRALPRALRHSIERHRMQVENDRLRDQQLRLKDEFLSHVSHELRSPLASIHSFASILADGLGGTTNPEQDQYLRIILNNVQQLQMMIEDLLEVSRMAGGSLSIDARCTQVAEAIAYATDSLREVARLKHIEIVPPEDLELPAVFADPMRVRQVLTILMDNALKFTPAGGTLSIGAGVSLDDNRWVRVSVTDTGCGIPPEECELVFRHLYQVSDLTAAGRKGLGLGLHIARELVTRMGGRIGVESVLNQGSQFFFTVPVFSLEALLAPLGHHEVKIGERIAVIAIDVNLDDASEQAANEGLTLVRKLLHQSLRPEEDVLLPSPDSDTQHRLFFVLAYTQELGAEVIVKRIANQFRRNQHLRSANFTFGISSGFLPVIVQHPDEPGCDFVDRLATVLRQYMLATGAPEHTAENAAASLDCKQLAPAA